MTTAPATTNERHASPTKVGGPGFPSVVAFELRKLRAQIRTKSVLAGVIIAPIPVALAIHSQADPPKDTLFGRYATTNGFALALLILGWAAQWGLPLLTAIVAGDIFASEDHHGTWKTVLTRSASRGSFFAAKVCVATLFAVLVLVLLGASTIVSSVVIGGHDPLTGMTGQLITASHAVQLVVLGWLSTVPPTLAFTGLAVLLSVWSRNAAVGIAAPVVLGLLMGTVGSTGGGEALRPYLPTTAYEAWHALFIDPPVAGPFLWGLLTSGIWAAATLAVSWAIFRRRDITGG